MTPEKKGCPPILLPVDLKNYGWQGHSKSSSPWVIVFEKEFTIHRWSQPIACPNAQPCNSVDSRLDAEYSQGFALQS